MTEVPEHLLQRSEARKEALGITPEQEAERAAEATAAEQEMEKARLALPESCRDCPIRPEKAGGNSLCSRLDFMMQSLGDITELFHVGRNGEYTDTATAILWKERDNDGLPTETLKAKPPFSSDSTISDSAQRAFNSIQSLMVGGNFGLTADTPAPEGTPVAICVKPLTELTNIERTGGEVFPLLNVARAIQSARQVGVKI